MMKKNPLLVPSAFIVTECMFPNAAYRYSSNDTNVYVNYPSSKSLKAIFGTVPANADTTYKTLQQWATTLGYKYYRYEKQCFHKQ